MFSRQLRKNIKMLDVEIGELSLELKGLMKDTKYDISMKALEDLTQIRERVAKSLKDSETSDILIELDKQIEEHVMILKETRNDVAYSEKLKKLEELTKARCQLAESKSKYSYVPVIVSSLAGLTTTLLVLKHEEVNVITSKAFNIATSMLRGR